MKKRLKKRLKVASENGNGAKVKKHFKVKRRCKIIRRAKGTEVETELEVSVVKKTVKIKKRTKAKGVKPIEAPSRSSPAGFRLNPDYDPNTLIDSLGTSLAGKLRTLIIKHGRQSKAVIILKKKTEAPVQNCIVAVNNEMRKAGVYPR